MPLKKGFSRSESFISPETVGKIYRTGKMVPSSKVQNSSSKDQRGEIERGRRKREREHPQASKHFGPCIENIHSRPRLNM